MKTAKVKTMKELFVKELSRIQGGQGNAASENPQKPMPPTTTLACCEEIDDACCRVE